MLYKFSSVTFTWITFQSTSYFFSSTSYFFFYLTFCPMISHHSSLVWYFILRETVKILCGRVQTQQTINCGYKMPIYHTGWPVPCKKECNTGNNLNWVRDRSFWMQWVYTYSDLNCYWIKRRWIKILNKSKGKCLNRPQQQHTGEGAFIVKSIEAECRPFRIDGVLQLLLCALME